MNEPARPNRSLQEKSAARLAAVQLLYQAELTGESLAPEKLAAWYKEYSAESRDVSPNSAYLKKLLSGIAEHGAALEPWLDKALTGDWKKERMSPLLLAILRLAIFELSHFQDLKTPIIINEYTSLAGRFFGEQETGFIHATLNQLAQQLRAS